MPLKYACNMMLYPRFFLKLVVDKAGILWYNIVRWLIQGEMAEWLKALVLKTSDVERHRGFESLSLRQKNIL